MQELDPGSVEMVDGGVVPVVAAFVVGFFVGYAAGDSVNN